MARIQESNFQAGSDVEGLGRRETLLYIIRYSAVFASHIKALFKVGLDGKATGTKTGGGSSEALLKHI